MADIQWTDDKVGELIGLKNNMTRAYIYFPTLHTHMHNHNCTKIHSSLTPQTTISYNAIQTGQSVRTGGTKLLVLVAAPIKVHLVG